MPVQRGNRVHSIFILALIILSTALLVGCNGSAPPARPAVTITEFRLPTNGAPEGITAGPDGNLWFTEKVSSQIGRITPQGKISEFSLPTPNGFPEGITAGPDGNLWFTELAGNIG